ncbi:hypothetical protein COLO4_21261 [Corchorus olitorius]|uniref:Uncharacterized protein n=1 Tax=Corchorus olitorius TaxID=93759 RepID=A0A1R3IUK8_9ROSI|nr:hypothetical protein COLO4_21261 [Corchorus olitorius]
MERPPRRREGSWENSSSSSMDSSDSEYEANKQNKDNVCWVFSMMSGDTQLTIFKIASIGNGEQEGQQRSSGDQESPWSFDGAFFFTKPWSPNQHVVERPMNRVEIWVRLWGLPLEYQHPNIAKKIAKAIGESVQALHKLWNHCPQEGVLHLPAQCCRGDDQPTNQRASERVDLPYVTIPTLNQFAAEMKAYRKRRSSRTTTFHYYGGEDGGAGTSRSIPSSPFELELEPIVSLDSLEPNSSNIVLLRNEESKNIQREIQEIMASIVTDRYNYETLYNQLQTKGEQVLEGLRKRAANDPRIQPKDNTPRWVSFHNGVFTLTNTKVVEKQLGQPKSSTMGEIRGIEMEQHAVNNMEFLLELETTLWQDDSDGEERTYSIEVLSNTSMGTRGVDSGN